LLKILLLVVLALAAVIVIVVVVGLCLPQSHVASRSITLRQSPETVFGLISNFQEASSWRSDARQMEILSAPNGQVRFREVSNSGTITYEVVESNPPHRLVTQIADKNLPFAGT